MMRRAAAAGLDVIALTDHDTVAGIAQAAAALPPSLTLIPGMELSCRRDEHSIHLLCYLFDPDHAALAAQRRALAETRMDRARAMVGRLAELGAPVTWEQVRAIAGDAVIGRPHIARAMVESGVIASADQAFTPEWIGTGGRAYVHKYALDPAEAIALVHNAGGVTVLAHPFAVTRGWTVPERLITDLASSGLDGVEVAHPDHDAEQRAELAALARGHDLAVTGGSDDHGELTGDRVGCESTDAQDLEQLLAAASGAQVITG